MTPATFMRAALCALALLSTASAAPQAPQVTAWDLAERLGLDDVFLAFGRTLSASPRSQGMADESFVAAWEETALSAFGDAALNRRLAALLEQSLSDEEAGRIAGFHASELGGRVGRLEAASETIPEEGRLAAIARGQVLFWRATAERQGQLRELLELSGAEIGFSMLAEAMRGMGMALKLSRGDFETPLEEIDTALRGRLAGMEESLAEAALAMLSLTFAELSDAELERYLEFLRSPEARKFYDTANFAVGEIIGETMAVLGRSVADRLRQTAI